MIHDGFGAELRRLRGDRSQQTVADAIGISQQAVARHEAGYIVPSDEIKAAYAEYYHVRIMDIFYRGIQPNGVNNTTVKGA